MFRPRDTRHDVLIRGRMRTDGPFVDVCVRNVSKNGMMLLAQQAPRRGTFVELRLPDDVIVGQVVWSNDRRFGIRTRERVPLSRLLGKPSPVERGRGMPHAATTGAAAIRRADARTAGRSMEFLVLVLAVALAAALLAMLGYTALADLAEQVGAHL